jgi:hypothetical protein
VYGAPLPPDVDLQVLRMRLFFEGHSLDEIDNMGFDDLGDVIGYLAGNALADKRQQRKGGK